MPLPRQKDDGSGGAPVLNILRAHVRLFDVEEHTEPYTVTRKSDGKQFELDPAFTCTIEVIDDGQGGDDNGVTFFESFKYKQDKNGAWTNKENSKLGQLTKVVKPGYFEDSSIPDLTAEDLEGFELYCRIKPRKDPQSGKVLGSVTDWETYKAIPTKVVAISAATSAQAEEAAFKDIPF
jgi:hypothetical protein